MDVKSRSYKIKLRINESSNNFLDRFTSISEIADILGMEPDELQEETLLELGLEDELWIDEIVLDDVKEYIRTRDDYLDTLRRNYNRSK